jgi:hypothetical protein
MAFILFNYNYSTKEFVRHCKANMNVAGIVNHIKWDESPMGREYWQCLYQAFNDDTPLNEGDDDGTSRTQNSLTSGSVSLANGWVVTRPIPTSTSIADELSTSTSDTFTIF